MVRQRGRLSPQLRHNVRVDPRDITAFVWADVRWDVWADVLPGHLLMDRHVPEDVRRDSYPDSPLVSCSFWPLSTSDKPHRAFNVRPPRGGDFGIGHPARVRLVVRHASARMSLRQSYPDSP